jgi:flagellar export protein FliJ
VKRLRWSLERVRRVRELQEEVARAAWAEAQRSARAAEERADALRAARDAARDELGCAPGRRIDAARAVQARDAVDRASRAVRSARERARTLAFQAARLRTPWEERRRDVRGLDELRARATETHRREARRAESAQLDEFAQHRAAARPTHDDEKS